MIDPKELRLGNAVHVRDSSPIGEQNSFIVEITSDELSIDKDNKLPGICCFPDELIGIPLTPEVFRQCGFVKTSYGLAKGGFTLYNYKGDLVFKVVDQIVNYNPIKHLHQLQNLYFALTGEELNLPQ